MARRGLASRGWLCVGAALLLFLAGIAARWARPRQTTPDTPEALVSTELDASGVEPAAGPHELPQEKHPKASKRSRETDALFTELRVLHVEVEIPPDGERTLQLWHWRR